MRKKYKLIINADDLGISLDVNNRIEDCIHRGLITSSTLLANAPAFEDGVRIAKQYTNISVGVHLNLVEFKPLTNPDIFKKYGIIDDDGCFIDGAIFNVLIGNELKKAIFEEWDSQINKIKEFGLTPTHCDSHQHTHTIKELQGVLCRVMEKHGIMKVRRKRIPSIRLMQRERKEPTVHLNKSNARHKKKENIIIRRIKVFLVKFENWKWNKEMSTHHRMTDSFYAFRYFYSYRKLLPTGVMELMCHPGHSGYKAENDYLMNDKQWHTPDIELISYRDI